MQRTMGLQAGEQEGKGEGSHMVRSERSQRFRSQGHGHPHGSVWAGTAPGPVQEPELQDETSYSVLNTHRSQNVIACASEPGPGPSCIISFVLTISCCESYYSYPQPHSNDEEVEAQRG